MHIGVAPDRLVSYPGSLTAATVQLEENHSYFILADSSEWGGETDLLIGLSAT